MASQIDLETIDDGDANRRAARGVPRLVEKRDYVCDDQLDFILFNFKRLPIEPFVLKVFEC